MSAPGATLKAALIASLSATLKLPTAGPTPAFVLPPAPAAPVAADGSPADDPVVAGPSHGSDSEDGSGSEDEDEADIAEADH